MAEFEPSGGPPLQPVPTLIIVQVQPQHVLLRFDTPLGVHVYWLSKEAARKVGQDIVNAATGIVVPGLVPPSDLQSG